MSTWSGREKQISLPTRINRFVKLVSTDMILYPFYFALPYSIDNIQEFYK